ncbi:thioesterase family protein [Terricaulis sp.]|uniref:thioesterase family protein n=1 Tax=Terricaulis sp. TaxID=2768686 RepID=UPI003783554F
MSHPAPLPAPLYQGSVNQWECDDGGHMNVRFHLERAFVGLAHFALALEMPRAFSASAGATLVPLEAHVRFLKEARPGAPLAMHGGVVKLGESDATLCLDMRHADGAPSSVFTLRVTHADTRGFRPFPWSARTRAAAAKLKVAAPAHAVARSIDMGKTPAEATLARAVEIGATRIGGAVVNPDQCDAFGRLRAEHFTGRISDSVPNLLAGWRQQTAAHLSSTGPKVEPAGAVVEARMVYRRWPRAGDLIEVYSGVAEVGDKTLRLAHWICDPETGAAWASMEAVALTFDTITRKAIAPSAEQRARMQARVVGIRA